MANAFQIETLPQASRPPIARTSPSRAANTTLPSPSETPAATARHPPASVRARTNPYSGARHRQREQNLRPAEPRPPATASPGLVVSHCVRSKARPAATTNVSEIQPPPPARRRRLFSRRTRRASPYKAPPASSGSQDARDTPPQSPSEPVSSLEAHSLVHGPRL